MQRQTAGIDVENGKKEVQAEFYEKLPKSIVDAAFVRDVEG